jgi:hypothetical protein
MQKACYNTATLCQHLNQKCWTGISKGDHTGYHCHGRRGQQVWWTYLSQLGISDGGRVQDEALWKVLHTQVPQRLNDLFFPTRKPLKIPLHMLSLSETFLLQVINITHQLLNHTNLTLARGFWMCQWTGPSQVITSPINISTHFTLNCSFTKRPTASTLSSVSLSQPALLCLQSYSGIVEVGSLVAKKCHTTRVTNKTRNNICSPPHSRDSLSRWSDCIPLPTPSLEGHLYSVIFGSCIITEDQDLPIPLTAHL